ncbi:hypothetical protein GZH47_10250 [Paenibacillus rhizovicinus]|uniref:ABC transporter permease n=1 Tax=Paenibacillus rhizovicinus TaxID=2704463 RepID=A0A6C0NYJ8_9BACL|nr:hypothetical protein [Paenibacillus rhizovicinus]QHW31201.1 hypothetical protein GZH47_10250 [Paenibacillus rhizovicinus]
MTTWQGAMTLLRLEGRRSWIGLLATMALFVYVGVVIIMPLFDDMLTQGGAKGYGYDWASNFLYLSLLPTMGFIMNRSMFCYWSRDSYTRKLAYWRTLPISWNAILVSRMLQHVVVLSIVSICFFATQYSLLAPMREQLAPGDFVLYVLTWYGYSMMVGATYVYLELTMKGKVYFVVCSCYLIFYALLVLILQMTDTNLVLRTIAASRHHHWLWPGVSLALGAAVTVLIGWLARMRLAKRSLLH